MASSERKPEKHPFARQLNSEQCDGSYVSSAAWAINIGDSICLPRWRKVAAGYHLGTRDAYPGSQHCTIWSVFWRSHSRLVYGRDGAWHPNNMRQCSNWSVGLWRCVRCSATPPSAPSEAQYHGHTEEGRLSLVGSARLRFRSGADHRVLVPCLLSVIHRPWPVGSDISAGT